IQHLRHRRHSFCGIGGTPSHRASSPPIKQPSFLSFPESEELEEVVGGCDSGNVGEVEVVILFNTGNLLLRNNRRRRPLPPLVIITGEKVCSSLSDPPLHSTLFRTPL
ncbi:hypothetical protein LINPERPRIM_LOCUS37287, partial [Linum perenne]